MGISPVAAETIKVVPIGLHQQEETTASPDQQEAKQQQQEEKKVETFEYNCNRTPFISEEPLE